MKLLGTLSVILFLVLITPSHEQRITTIQLDGVQYFVSRMNPYSPELNFFLAYQYCRSLGLQLVSFETREKADSITQYLSNAGFTKYDFWTSGNKLGTNMYLWMSSGLPFNSTFNYLKRPEDEASAALTDVVNSSTSPQRTARESGDSGSSNGCVALKAPTLEWATDDCTSIKDFICEQTRCYYYNYGSIPVSSAQGKPNYEKSPTKPSVLPSSSSSSLSSSTSSSSSLSSSSPPPPSSLNIADFMTRLRSSSTLTTNANVDGKEDVKEIDDSDAGDNHHHHHHHQATDTAVSEDTQDTEEESTNGPYESVMRDDPHALNDDHDHDFHDHDHELVHHDEHVEEDAYVSTIIPEYVTTLNPSMVH